MQNEPQFILYRAKRTNVNIYHSKQVWLWNTDILASEIEYAKLVIVSTSVKGGLAQNKFNFFICLYFITTKCGKYRQLNSILYSLEINLSKDDI